MKILVIGGGISGLSSAFRTKEALASGGFKCELTVLESQERVGGAVRTYREDGWKVEAGPNGFLDGKPGGRSLVQALRIEDRLLPADHAAKRRYLFVDGELRELPASPMRFLGSRILPLTARLRFMLEPLMPRGPDDETVADLGRRRLGRHAVERMLDPMVSGIFAGDVEKLSVTSAFPAVKKLEREQGSLVRGMMVKRREQRKSSPRDGSAGGPAGPGGHLQSLASGIGELTETLTRQLGDVVRTGAEVESLRSRQAGGFIVTLKDGEELTADVVISAAPAYAAADYSRELDDGLSSELSAIHYAPIVVVAVGLREQALSAPLDGFGFLIPSREGERILGCLWDSSIYPDHRAPPGHVLTRTMIGGARAPELSALADDDLLALVKESHLRTMGLRWDDPAYLRIMRYEKGIPQYPVGHQERVARIDAAAQRHPGLFVTGNHLRGIGMNECASDAEAVAAAVRRYLEGSQTGSKP